ncbi:MAG: GNAT family N-acetyltransferase [Crenarchaeota archaeon]|nr:GNAT family N-acetyltransferase [Thermoproteota archaeon]
MGWWHRYYAEAVARSSIGTWLCLRVGNRLAGATILYTIPLKPSIGVIYYIAVHEDLERRGLGKVLLASSEEILELRGCRIFVASTTVDNDGSRKLFRSMGYREILVDELFAAEPNATELLVRALCSFEDDVVMLKGCEVNELLELLKRNRAVIRGIWRRICYEPWLRMRGG